MVVSERLTLVVGICYMVAHSIGAIVGVLCVSAAIPNEFHVGMIFISYITLTSSATNIIQNGELGATVLGAGVSLRTDFFVEALLTFSLLFVIFGCGVNSKGPQVTAPCLVGSTVAAAHLIGCNLTGGSLNLARSLGSALVANIWRDVWLYWIGPFMGALVAVITVEVLMRPSGEVNKNYRLFLKGEDE